jgi:hypothetical protein
MTTYDNATKFRVIDQSIGNDFIKLIEEYNDDRWDWGYVSRHPLVSLDYIKAHPELPWDYYWMSSNPNITLDFVKENIGETWEWQALSSSEGISLKEIRENPEFPWDWVLGGVSRNPSVTLEDVRDEANVFISTKVFFKVKLSDITEEEIFKYCHFLSCNKSLTWEDINTRPHCPWMWPRVSSLPCITLEIVLSNPEKDWSWNALSGNLSITLEQIKNTPQLPWEPRMFSDRSDVTWEFVQANPNMGWDYDTLSSNPKITFDIISANRHLFTDMTCISRNPSLTFEDIKNHDDLDWDWDALVNNVFAYEDEVFKKKGEPVLQRERDELDEKFKEGFRTLWCSGNGKVNIPDISAHIEKFMTMF